MVHYSLCIDMSEHGHEGYMRKKYEVIAIVPRLGERVELDIADSYISSDVTSVIHMLSENCLEVHVDGYQGSYWDCIDIYIDDPGWEYVSEMSGEMEAQDIAKFQAAIDARKRTRALR